MSVEELGSERDHTEADEGEASTEGSARPDGMSFLIYLFPTSVSSLPSWPALYVWDTLWLILRDTRW